MIFYFFPHNAFIIYHGIRVYKNFDDWLFSWFVIQDTPIKGYTTGSVGVYPRN